MFIVTTNSKFYPTVDYFTTREEAETFFNETLKEAKDSYGNCNSAETIRLSLSEVIKTTPAPDCTGEE